MSTESKALSNKLDRDFLSYLTLTKPLFDKVEVEDEKTLCEAWLTKLCGKCITTVRGKRNRNIYLSRLLLQMQDGKLKDIFLNPPPAGDLECPFKVFGLPLEVEDLKDIQKLGFQLDTDAAGGSGDFSELSRDGRTYLATREIKNGMMAYLAVTLTEDEPMWLPQQTRTAKPEEVPVEPRGPGRFVRRLKQFECIPLGQLRRTPEQRERVLEWMDKIIEDCNKWLRGEDPNNMDLESLFQMLLKDYEEDPAKAEVLMYPKDVRDILMRDIRQKIMDRRNEVTRRELVLDQYEADEYVEEKFPPLVVDNVWRQCAKRPIKDYIRRNLENAYPCPVVDRFFELLVQERMLYIEKAERELNRKVAEMRNDSLEDLKKELQKLKKVKQEYQEYYSIYKEAEAYEMEYANMFKESGKGTEKSLKKQDMMKLKDELEQEIEGYRRRCEKERKTQGELVERLEEAKDTYSTLKDSIKDEEIRLKCEKDDMQRDMQKLNDQIMTQKKRLCELKKQMKMKQSNSGC